MRILLAVILPIVLASPAFHAFDASQGGDQFLDGIGETALVARYAFRGNTEDSSRNNFHATLRGAGEFIEDTRFGRVLEVAGSGAYVQLPGQALTGEDTISVTGWFYLPTGATGPLFDFGQSASSRIFATVNAAGLRAGAASGATLRETAASAVPVNQWIHVAVVLDPARRVLTAYLDGAKVGQATDVAVNAAQLINQASSDANHLYIGRSQDAGAATLQGRLRDVRVYRVALTDAQVTTIYGNGSGRAAGGRRGATPPPVISTAAIPRESPLASRLDQVPDIQAQTTVGNLPRLPREIPAVYRGGAAGPKVRVIWPSPKDNSQVTKPGTYTVTGTVPGTTFQPKATVTVIAAGEAGGRPGAHAGDIPARPRRPQPGHEGPRHAVHQEPRQVHPRPGRRRTPTASSTTSGTRSGSRSRPARSSSAGGTTRRRGCAATRAATTCRPSPRRTRAPAMTPRCRRTSCRR